MKRVRRGSRVSGQSVLTKVIRVASATWLVVVFLGLILGIPYVIGRPSNTSPLEDPIVRMLFVLVATSVPAAIGLAYASHRRRVEEMEEWMQGLR